MAQTPDINATQGGAFSVIRSAAQEIKATVAGGMGVYNVPAPNINSTQVSIQIPYRRIAQDLPVTQATVLAVVRGTIETPNITSWYFTLDGHDMFVLKLGTSSKTLIYDLSTQTWSWWCSNQRTSWRAMTGMNWRSAGGIPNKYGSNVIVGDDSLGTLWVLDPSYQVDDGPLQDADPLPFERVATGFLTTTTRKFEQIFEVWLNATKGDPYNDDQVVNLTYSDDQGYSYTVADEPILMTSGAFNQEYKWQSLGLMNSPGRLFKITDNGAFRRIDSMDVNDR